jgi:heptaprenylglyceryl phosphate synthase
MLSIPIIVGGGVSTKEDARTFVEAGADIIVMGTFLENQVLKDDGNSLKTIIDEIKKAGKNRKNNYKK